MGLLPYQVGLILSVNRWIRLLTNTLAERMCRRYNLTLLFGVALAAGAATTAAYGVSSSFTILLAARMAWGLCWSFIRQIGLTTVADTTQRFRLGRMTGLYNGVSRLGSVTGNALGGLLTDAVGFTTTLLAFGAASLFGVPLGTAARRAVPHTVERDSPRVRLRKADAGLLLCGVMTGSVGPGMMMATLGMVLKSTVGESVTVLGTVVGVATLSGLLLASRWVTDGLGAPLLGALSDRIGRRKASVIYFGCGSTALLGASLTTTALPLVLLVLAFFTCGVGQTVVNLTEANHRGARTLAAYVTAVDLGAASGPVLGWMTVQAALPTSSIFLIAGGLYLVGLLASRWAMGSDS